MKEDKRMKAKYIDLTKSIDDSVLKEVGAAIRNGKLVVFPTETVYGIGTNGLDDASVQKIYEAKGRSNDNPLILHISDETMLHELTINPTSVEKQLIKNYFPGPFTLILNKSPIVPYAVTAGLETVAIRMPSHQIAQKLIGYAGVPIAAPSANLSGKPSGTVISDIINELGDKVDYILDAGPCSIGLESTVVCVIDEVPTILRPGKVTQEELLSTIGTTHVDQHILSPCDTNETVLSPGMKYRHYAPDTKCILIDSNDNEKLVNTINSILQNYPRVLVISSHENCERYQTNMILDMGLQNDLDNIAKNIFTTLRKVDSYDVNFVIIEAVRKTGIGLALMNRLLRTCEYHYYNLDEKENENE